MISQFGTVTHHPLFIKPVRTCPLVPACDRSVRSRDPPEVKLVIYVFIYLLFANIIAEHLQAKS